MNKPITNCYWVDRYSFLAGEYPGAHTRSEAAERIAAFERSDVELFIDLTEEGELEPYVGFLTHARHQRYPIRDVSVPESREQVYRIIEAIDTTIANGGRVYLHCWGGIGRTGTIVGCWLAHHGLSGEAALIRLTELWKTCPKSEYRDSPETPAQRNYILSWGRER